MVGMQQNPNELTVGVCSLPGVPESWKREQEGEAWKTPELNLRCKFDRSRCAGVYPIVSYTSYSGH